MPAQVILLSAALVLINVSWQAALVAFAHRRMGPGVARRWLIRSDVNRAIGRVTDGILIAFAAALVWEHVA